MHRDSACKAHSFTGQPPSQYVDRLTDSIAKITAAEFQSGCDMKGIIQAFVRSHLEDFQLYYDKFKALSDMRRLPIDLIRKILPAEVQTKVIREAKKSYVDKLPPETIKQYGGREHVTFPFTDEDLLYYFVLKRESGTVGFFKSSDFATIEANIDMMKEASDSLVRLQRDKITPLERQLYVKIKGSDDYVRCVSADPKLAQAKRNCENFELPGQ